MRELELSEVELVSGGYQPGTDGPSTDGYIGGRGFTNDRIGRSIAGNSAPGRSRINIPRMDGYDGAGWILAAAGTGALFAPVGIGIAVFTVATAGSLAAAQYLADNPR